MKAQNILFDLDDTLTHCNKYFELVIDQFADQIQTWFCGTDLTEKEIMQKQLEIDITSVHQHGFTTEHFPQSLIDTYTYFCSLHGRKQKREETEWLRKLGYSVYEQEVEPYPNMVETLQTIKEAGHTLILYTGGDAAVQQRKVNQMGLEAFFEERIYISVHKTFEVLEAILSKDNFDRKNTWMVGNSIRTDIIPALQTGIHAIYIPAMSEWEYNITEISVEPKGAFLTLASLKQVPMSIQQYVLQNVFE